MLLEIDNITLLYGRIQALHGISMQVEQGEIVALIGANGAGKTTTMRAISGLRPIASGRILFQGEDISNVRADLRVIRGIGQSPEGRGIFPGMTVRENLDMGASTRKDTAEITQDLDRVMHLFPRLKERERQQGGTLSGGEQQMLAVARALARDIKLLLLDEPYEGLAPVIVQEIEKILEEVKALGFTTLIVEQNAIAALHLADRAIILDMGEVVYDGSAQEVLNNADLRQQYLAI
jgi:branched-chain amino acid transport system ATP-binding protein